MCRYAAILFLIMVMFTVDAAPLTDLLVPNVPYYCDDFNPDQKPWTPGQKLNLEEVFKNYQYYEVVLDTDGRHITVIKHVKGSVTGSEIYLLLPDGALQKIIRQLPI